MKSDLLNIQPPSPLFSIETLAAYLAVPVDTIQKWRTKGRLPAPDIKIGERLIRWKFETIYSRIESGQFLD